MYSLENLCRKHFALISPDIIPVTSLDYSFIIPRNIETNYATYVLENRSDIFQDYNASFGFYFYNYNLSMNMSETTTKN